MRMPLSNYAAYICVVTLYVTTNGSYYILLALLLVVDACPLPEKKVHVYNYSKHCFCSQCTHVACEKPQRHPDAVNIILVNLGTFILCLQYNLYI
jgi:hypothetical protein